ncbi:hypothetical protein D3C77_717690 [compost metagenome]
MNKVFGGTNRQVVHHLQAARDDPGGNDFTDCAPGFLHRVKAGQQHFSHLRLGQQLDRDFDDDPEHAFRASEQREQVEAG